jgi:glycosyltransferase involved in cell wall biosynthesis
MRRVLMISPHFPPDTSAGTHRVRLFAPYLPEFGWEPTVVSVDPSAYEGRLDPDLARLVPDTVRVVRTPAWSAAVTRRIGIGDLGLRALSGLGRECRRLMSTEHFDALFITIYPTYPAMLGPMLKRRYGVPFVLDYQDPWVSAWGLDVGPGPNGTPDARSRITRALAQQIEPRVVRAADALTAVSARTYEDVLARVRDARPRTCAAIPLGFDERDLEALHRAPRANSWFDERDGLVHICYVGTILPKGFDVLRTVLAALARLRLRTPLLYARLRVHFIGTSNQRSASTVPRVLPAAREAGVDDIITEAPPRLDYLDALNVQTRADALLLLGSSERHYTPSKVFPAILAGKPIVALYHRASSVVDVLRHPSLAARVFTFDEEHPPLARVDDIAKALADLIEASPSIPRTSNGGGLEAWSARALTGRLAAVLDAVGPR